MPMIMEKEEACRIVDRMPPNATWDDLLREIYVLVAAERGGTDSNTAIKLLYGDEFWTELEQRLCTAQNRVFLASAYMGKHDYEKCIAKIPQGVFTYSACRSDSAFKPSDNCLIMDHAFYHGKIYLIDNSIIIGSQNLYNAGKSGEFSVLIQTDKFTSSLVLYQALLQVAVQADAQIEPVNPLFLQFYSQGCPFCGAIIAEPLSIYRCTSYGGGFVSQEDCNSYGETGACKYCSPEFKESLGECYCCDQAGCGFGIALASKELIYHEFGPPDEIHTDRAKAFLRLFNFISSRIGVHGIEFFRAFGLTGRIFDARLERMEWMAINTHQQGRK